MEKKTAEQILSEYYEKGALDGEDHVIIAAMEEYAALQTASLQSSLSEKEAEIERLSKAVVSWFERCFKAEAEIERLRGALEEKTAKVLPVEEPATGFIGNIKLAAKVASEAKELAKSVSEGKEDEQEIIKDLLEDIEIMRGKTSTRHVIVKVIMERYHITRK
jgi:chromosome segregation ATPase